MIQIGKVFSSRSIAAALVVGGLIISQVAFASSSNLLQAMRAEHSGRGAIQHWIDAMESEPRLRQTLASSGTFTLFVPNDKAFEELHDLDACGAIDLNANLLSTLLNHHVVRGAANAANHGESRTARTRLGAPISIADEMVRDTAGTSARFDGPRIEARNGVAHVIDKVLWPFPVPTCS